MIDAHGAPKDGRVQLRLGDPETQPILMRLKSDLFELLMQAAADDGARSTRSSCTGTGAPRSAS